MSLGDYGGVPVLSRWSGRAFYGTVALIEGGIGGYWLTLAFARHQELYNLVGVDHGPVSPIAYAVLVLAFGGLLLLHDAVHRMGRAIRGA